MIIGVFKAQFFIKEELVANHRKRIRAQCEGHREDAEDNWETGDEREDDSSDFDVGSDMDVDDF